MIERATEEENKQRGRKGRQFVTEVKRERYYDPQRDLHGIYTEKICNVRSLLPSFIKAFIPESSSILVEKAWNSFPDRCMTVYESPFLGDAFHLSIESRFVEDDSGTHTNALRLSDADLQNRQVVTLNIANEEHLSMTAETNVQNCRSVKAHRPVLDADGIWIRGEQHPVMCCYKVARLHASKFGLGSRIEKWGHKHGLQASFLRFHRKQWCWIDSWFGLNVSDVDGMNDGFQDPPRPTKRRESTSSTFHHRSPSLSTSSISSASTTAECAAALAFAFSDETNPFFA